MRKIKIQILDMQLMVNQRFLLIVMIVTVRKTDLLNSQIQKAF